MSKVKALFAAAGRQYKAVEIDGGTVYVGKVTVGVRARYIDLIQKNDWNQAMALLVQTCTFDDDLGSRSFEDGDADLAGIMASPTEVVDALARAIMSHNGMDDAADPVKDAAKN